MARKKKPTRLSPGELEIMELLWTRGEATLAEAHQAFDRDVGYTTMQTRLNRLVDKGVVGRSSDRPAVYRPLLAREDVTAGLVDQFRAWMSAGSVAPLVAQLVQEESLTDEELSQLRHLIDEAQRQRRQRAGEDQP